ncbi:shikimate dehydrogenase [uncultured Parasphingorhabdus sp.]|uniref:shikimate dehydrogenase n=1 Tax=uncultured Parasphingorhabdus sp. TaxID=2709694 RepID=UPI0030DA8AFA|tara:strand:- start:14296 stop:15114 length:819 start_codon:yes stop_codon:yes gene_type:complete
MTTAIPYADVIGDPIAQSKSPLIHKFWLDRLAIKADYRRHHVTPDELADYIEQRRSDPAWRGCNVTLPHKIAIMDLVSDPGGVREKIGAMNTIVRQEDGSLIGTNTDAAGFMAPIADTDWSGKHAVVIGAGGAARAVLFALKQVGIGEITFLARSGLKATGLLMQASVKGSVLPMDARLPEADLLINASPLGMTGKAPLEVDLDPLPADALVYDLVYAPLETGLLRAAKKRDLAVVDGLDMLIGQAALAFELFFGATPPMEDDAELRKLLIA